MLCGVGRHWPALNTYTKCYSLFWGSEKVLYLFCYKRRDIRWNIAWARGKSQGQAQRISRGLRLYFIVYPDSSHNIEILNYNSSNDLPGRSKLEELIFSCPEQLLKPSCLLLAALSSSWSLVVCWLVGPSVGNVCEKVTFRVSKDY